jgi:hypothetical protein
MNGSKTAKAEVSYCVPRTPHVIPPKIDMFMRFMHII